MKLIKKLDLYILKKFLLIFAGAFLVVLFVFMMQFTWRYVDDLIGKGLSLDILAKFYWYMAITLVRESLPLSVLLASLITFGNLGESFELLAMNKLHLIVPLGKEASRGDQIENAQYFVDKGYAEQLQEDQLTLETFNETIQEMLKQSQVYHQAMEKSTELLSLDDFYGLLQKDISKGKDDGRQ